MYYSLSDFQLWLYWVLSLCALIVSCYLPGWLLLSKVKIESKLTETALSFVVGIVLWGLQGYVFGYTHFRWGSYVYIASALFLAWKERKNILSSLRLAGSELTQLPKIVMLSMLVAVFFQILAHIGSGLLGPKGLGFYFVNAADGVMHLAYIQSMTTNFPPIEPGYAGTQLLNYHYWSDLVFAEFARVWHLPVINLFFQFIPLPLLVLTTVLWVQLIRYFKGSVWTIAVGLFLLTFGADAAFIFAQYFNHNWGAAIPALDTGVSFVLNMPQVFSRLVFIAAVLIFLQWIKTKNTWALSTLILLGASLFGFKIYYGIYFVMGFGFYTLYKLITDFWHSKKIILLFKTNTYLLVSWVVLTILAAAIFLPNNRSAGGLQVVPLAWPKVFLSSENFNYRDWWLRMQVYEQAKNYRNIFIYNTIAVIITLVAIYGIRIIGIIPSKNTVRTLPKELLWFLVPTNIIFVIIGFVFFQVSLSGGLNIYNFLITPILAFNLFTAFAITKIKDLTTRLILIGAVVALCFPRTLMQINEYYQTYYSQRPSVVISNEELELLSHAKSLKSGAIQADNHNSNDNIAPYVSFLSDKSSFLDGNRLLETHNIDTKQRAEEVTSLFNATTAEEIASKMKVLGISYLFVTDSEYVNTLVKAAGSSSPLKIEKQNEVGAIISVE